MNGNPQRLPPNVASPLNRSSNPLPPGSPTAGLIPTIASSLRNVLINNNNALNQAISQLEVVGDIQNELVAARAAHAQVSRDLRVAMDQNMSQGFQLQQSRNDMNIVTQKLHGAREQLRLLEARIASGDLQMAGRHASQDTRAREQFEALNSAFNSANQQIIELTKKLQMATSAATVAQTSENVLPAVDTLATSSTRVHDLEKRLAVLLKLSDEDFNADANQPIPAVGPNTNGEMGRAEKLRILAHFKNLRSEFDSVRNSAQAYASRNAALEATLTTIRALHIEAAPLVTHPLVSHSPELIAPAVQQLPNDGDVEMDIERTEAARTSRQVTQPPTPSQPTHQIQLPTGPMAPPSAPATPSQPTFFAQSDIPQRKRQRTLTEASTPEPLPRDDILNAFIRIVQTMYEIGSGEDTPSGEAGAQTKSKRLVCKLCKSRHNKQPDYQVTSFPYDQDTPVAVPSLANAESTRTLVRPWVEHVQEGHPKPYTAMMDKFKANTSATQTRQ